MIDFHWLPGWFIVKFLGSGPDHKDNMIEALPTLKDRLQKGDPNVLYSVVNDLSKVTAIKILKIWMSEKFAVITLKFEQGGITIEYCIKKVQTELQTV